MLAEKSELIQKLTFQEFWDVDFGAPLWELMNDVMWYLTGININSEQSSKYTDNSIKMQVLIANKFHQIHDFDYEDATEEILPEELIIMINGFK